MVRYKFSSSDDQDELQDKDIVYVSNDTNSHFPYGKASIFLILCVATFVCSPVLIDLRDRLLIELALRRDRQQFPKIFRLWVNRVIFSYDVVSTALNEIRSRPLENRGLFKSLRNLFKDF